MTSGMSAPLPVVGEQPSSHQRTQQMARPSSRKNISYSARSSPEQPLLAADGGNTPQSPDVVFVTENMSATRDTHSKDLQRNSFLFVSGDIPLHFGGRLHHSTPVASLLREGADPFSASFESSLQTRLFSEHEVKMPQNVERSGLNDGQQYQEQKLKTTAKWHGVKEATGQSSHALCKTPETAKKEDVASETREEALKQRFIDSAVTEVTKKIGIHSDVVNRLLQAFKQYDEDLDSIVKMQKNGVCSERYRQIINRCIHSVASSMDASNKSQASFQLKGQHNYTEAGSSDSEYASSTPHDEVPHVAHSPQRASSLPQYTWDQRDSSFSQVVKQEPHTHDLSSQLDAEKHDWGQDRNGTATENTVTADGELSDQPVVGYSQENHPEENTTAMQSTRDILSTETGVRGDTDKAPRTTTAEAANLSQMMTKDRKTRDAASTSDGEEFENRKPESAPEDADRLSSAEGSAEVEESDRELELSLRVPEDDSNVQVTQGGVTVVLLGSSVWRAFASVGTEMIINRAGRRMFPFVAVLLRGLEERDMYEVQMQVMPADNQRYKFNHKLWTAVGVADAGVDNLPYSHPESPNTGKHWMSREVQFSRVKLTNNRESSERNMLLNSMHKYVVQIRVTRLKWAYVDVVRRTYSFRLDLTSFIAVTAYQNDLVTRLKIHNNPFAKAFRDCNLPVSQRKTLGKRRHMDLEAAEMVASKHQTLSGLLYPGGGGTPSVLRGAGPLSRSVGPGAFYPVTATDHSRLSVPQTPPLVWGMGVHPSSWLGLGQGLIHPSFYPSLPLPNNAWDTINNNNNNNAS